MKDDKDEDKIIIIIRHAEKISDDYVDLSPKGKIRAECLPKLFSESGLKYIPSKLYANKRIETTTRPYDTLVPLAKILNLEIEEFDKLKAEEFAKNKLINSKHNVILVCSSRGKIPIITKVLGHEIIVESNEFDKYYIWKNGKYFKEGKQSDYIGKLIQEKYSEN